MSVIAVGSLNMDFVAIAPHIPAPGETITGTASFAAPGGKGANQAYAAARLGADVHFIGAVGRDVHGDACIRQLEEAGCAVEQVFRFAEATGAAFICVATRGDNSIVVVPGANARLTPDLARNALTAIGPGPGDILLLQRETPAETVCEAAEFGHRAGATVILDPAPAPRQVSPALLKAIDILTPNESELCLLSGLEPTVLDSDQAAKLARELVDLGPTVVVVKLGARGCLLVERNRTLAILAPDAEAIDTTGAGDVFNAALAFCLQHSTPLEDACRFAVQAATWSVTKHGAQASAPTFEDLKSLHPVLPLGTPNDD